MVSNVLIVVGDMHQVDGLDSENGSSTAALGLEAEETPLLPDAECESSRPKILSDDTAAVVMKKGKQPPSTSCRVYSSGRFLARPQKVVRFLETDIS